MNKMSVLKSKVIFSVLLIFVAVMSGNMLGAQVKIGVFADCQYCDCNASGSRYYRNSLDKLNACITEFNSVKDLDFIVGLGDLIDRDFSSYKKVNSILQQANAKVYNVVGNHDFSVEPEYFNEVPLQLGLKKNYYSIEKDGWKFIFLNGNEITFQTNDKKVIKQAEKMVSKLTAAKKPNNQEWNGGISKTQFKWLKKELKESEKRSLKVALFCHFPILPNEIHSLWNNDEVLGLIKKFSSVKVWINGHNHAGGYTKINGIHFITMRGMVETESGNSFSVVTFGDTDLRIKAYGREVERVLSVAAF